jgi:hypothetical protein
MLIKHTLSLSIDGRPQTKETLTAEAEKNGVGFGESYLAIALVKETDYLSGDKTNISDDQFDTVLENSPNTLIDMAASSAIRDIAVCAEVLKEQITQNLDRRSFLKGVLWWTKYIREKEVGDLDKVHAGQAIAEYMRGAAETVFEDFESTDPEKQEALLKSISAGIEALEKRDDAIDKLSEALHNWIDEDKMWGKYSDDDDVYELLPTHSRERGVPTQ